MKDTKEVQEQNLLENKTKKQNKMLRLVITLCVVAVFALGLYLILKLTGSLEKLTKPEQIKTMILNAGVWGYLLFFVVQFLQATFIPIPAIVTTIAGLMVFDVWNTLWISIISILLASAFSFWLGRKFGKKLVYWIIGKEEAERYNNELKKGKYAFFLMLLFPGFPDDILCILAGMTNMTFRFFITSNLITRPIVISLIVFFGSGSIIPFSGWGIYAWIVLALFMIFAFYYSVKKQPEIEAFIGKLSNKMSKVFKKKS